MKAVCTQSVMIFGPHTSTSKEPAILCSKTVSGWGGEFSLKFPFDILDSTYNETYGGPNDDWNIGIVDLRVFLTLAFGVGIIVQADINENTTTSAAANIDTVVVEIFYTTQRCLYVIPF